MSDSPFGLFYFASIFCKTRENARFPLRSHVYVWKLQTQIIKYSYPTRYSLSHHIFSLADFMDQRVNFLAFLRRFCQATRFNFWFDVFMISIFGLMKQMLALFCLKIPKFESCGRILLKKFVLVRCFLSWRSPWGFLISISKWPRNVERRILCTWGYISAVLQHIPMGWLHVDCWQAWAKAVGPVRL